MKDKYEISLWEDYPDTNNNNVPFLNERKLCVIGSDTMDVGPRAFEPTMVNNVNGTNTFTFKMYYTYFDEITGERNLNPFLSLLINERKVKVYWKDKWYDMLIKNISEDSKGNSVTYTCEDSFITELSKNGYNLEFTSDLQNNIGTASDLVEQVLDGSGWQLDQAHSNTIIQKKEESVYEVIVNSSFNGVLQEPNSSTIQSIPAKKKILVFYPQINNLKNGDKVRVQFAYNPDYIGNNEDERYETDLNSSLVINSNCYKTNSPMTVSISNREISFYLGTPPNHSVKFIINMDNGISSLRAMRVIETQKTEYDKLLDRYVNVYTDTITNKKVYGYQTTEFTDPLSVVNLIVNSSNFTNVSGWELVKNINNDELTYGVYPKFDNNTVITDYNAISYLRMPGYHSIIRNSVFQTNSSYFTTSQGQQKLGNFGGIHVNDKYIFRIKYKNNNNGPSVYSTGDLVPFIGTYNASTEAKTQYFTVTRLSDNNNWTEFLLTCTSSCSVDELSNINLYIENTNDSGGYGYARWIEEVQFYKYVIGTTSYESGAQQQRIDPGGVAVQSIEKTIYRYYNADHDGVTKIENLKFLYEDEQESDRFEPVTNNYEKLSSIEVKNSNRFNILQSIAESFKCWIRFNINHDSTGKMTFDSNGLPQKYVTIVEYLGKDLGWSFEYGIDLQGINRQIISNELVTKLIVLPNENEFAQNGFCTIARSKENYIGENFILDFGYYIDQGLLDKDMVNRDLYGTSNDYIGYFYNLKKYNSEYDEITNLLSQKQLELTKQQSQLTVLKEKQNAMQDERNNCKTQIMTLACVSTWSDAQYYVRNHTDNIKVQSLMNTIAQLSNSISLNADQISQLESSVTKLKNYINTKISRQDALRGLIKDLHNRFFKKYSRYIQEGTWQDSNYIDDDKYFLDAVDVAYTSSRPQLQYNISVIRLSGLEDFSSKTFEVGDICYIQDKDFFGYTKDGITPYKLKITISEITSYFDQPEKDVIKVQNYKTQFDDLFQRITATTQSLQYSEGGFTRAAEGIQPDRTLSFDLLQDTFDYNENLALNANNQQVVWDSTGITITDDKDTAQKLRLMAGGLFITNDGGTTWKNAIRGDGISTDVLTAGRINTSEVYLYDGTHTAFRWDSNGITAYSNLRIAFPSGSSYPAMSQFVRFDQFGIYGYTGTADFVPLTEDSIWENPNSKFGLTWKGFFLRGSNGNSALNIEDNGNGITFKLYNGDSDNSIEISSNNDILVKTRKDANTIIKRIQIGRIGGSNYGMIVRDKDGNTILNVSSSGSNSIGGWNLTSTAFETTTTSEVTIGLYANGKSATIQGRGTKYYFLAGNNFGVATDGKIYAAGGRIAGWTINQAYLQGGNIRLNSSGEIICSISSVEELETPLPAPVVSTILLVAKSYIWPTGTSRPSCDYDIVNPKGISMSTAQKQALRTALSNSGYKMVSFRQSSDSSNSYKIRFGWSGTTPMTTYTFDGATFDLQHITGTAYKIDSEMWKINNEGKAYFQDIQAVGGTIAGWHIDNERIWNDSGTTLDSGGGNSYNVNRYSITTNSISAGGGSIGGWSFGNNSMTVGGAILTGNSAGLLISGALGVTGTISVGSGGAIFLDTDGSIRGSTLKLGSTEINEDDLKNLKKYSSHQHTYSGWNYVYSRHENGLYTGTPV